MLWLPTEVGSGRIFQSKISYDFSQLSNCSLLRNPLELHKALLSKTFSLSAGKIQQVSPHHPQGAHQELIKMFVAVNLIIAFHCSGLCRGSPLLPLQKCRGSMEMIKFFPFLVEVVSQPWFQVASAFNAEQLYGNRSVVSFHSLNENTRKCSSMCDTTFTFLNAFELDFPRIGVCVKGESRPCFPPCLPTFGSLGKWFLQQIQGWCSPNPSPCWEIWLLKQLLHSTDTAKVGKSFRKRMFVPGKLLLCSCNNMTTSSSL